MSVEKVKQEAMKALSCTGPGADLAAEMALEHVISEAFWRACQEAHHDHVKKEDDDDFAPLASLAMNLQATMYRHNRAKKALAIQIVDQWRANHPDAPAVVLANSILRGESETHRFVRGEPKTNPDHMEKMARSVAKQYAELGEKP